LLDLAALQGGGPRTAWALASFGLRAQPAMIRGRPALAEGAAEQVAAAFLG
jgi:hypothetical protein